MMDERKFWVGFNRVKGIGAVRTRRLLDFFGKLSLAWDAPLESLRAAGMTEKVIEQFQQVRHDIDLDVYWQKILDKNIQVITWMDENYPKRLKEIDQPPPVIYFRGKIESVDDWAVAIVGTRRVTTYGRQITQDTAAYLAGNGITIVSGLARGVDALAHQAALGAGGRTIAVLGSGVDIIYPSEHRKLADAIMEHGAIISDYAPGTPPDGVNFPPRNRIISGLSRATIVIEAGQKSGALITAQFANEQGRDVFAVPGSILSPMSRGTNQLISEGATPLTNPKDVLDTLGYTQIAAQQSARHELPVEPDEAKIISALGYEPMHVDDLCARLDMPIEKLTACLTMMELKGLVRQAGGMQYTVIRERSQGYQIN
jgi:DNA processing protein